MRTSTAFVSDRAGARIARERRAQPTTPPTPIDKRHSTKNGFSQTRTVLLPIKPSQPTESHWMNSNNSCEKESAQSAEAPNDFGLTTATYPTASVEFYAIPATKGWGSSEKIRPDYVQQSGISGGNSKPDIFEATYEVAE